MPTGASTSPRPVAATGWWPPAEPEPTGSGPAGGNPADRPHVWAMPSQSTPAIPYSLLDLAPVTEGRTPAAAFANSLDLARHAESLSYPRFWPAGHPHPPGIASS